MIEITDNAAKYFKKIILEKKVSGIQIKIVNNGCSGKSYFLDFINNKEIKEDNELFSFKGIDILMKKKDLIYLKNIKIDLLKNDFGEKITFSNPNILEKCGCGESFKDIRKN